MSQQGRLLLRMEALEAERSEARSATLATTDTENGRSARWQCRSQLYPANPWQ